MADLKTKPAAPAAAEPAPEKLAVALAVDDWAAVLQLVELGVKTAGATTFENGGRVMREIAQQLQPNVKR
jgi:hypothetical protein